MTWELFKKRKNGKFTTTNIKKVGISSFTFGEVASQHTYRLEAYLHKPEGGGLIINPKPSKIPKIGKIEFHYVDDEKGDTFSFHDKLRAKAHTTNLVGKELIFTLWEDDAKGKGHNANNKAIDSKPAKVGDNGSAIAEFMLTKALIQKAMQGEADAKQLEFYVTVEYYIGKKHDSENVNINNPLYKAPAVPEKKNGKPKAKGSPAEQKPISKKEEKGIVSIAMENLWDWAESKGKPLKDLEIRLPKIEGKSMVEVSSPKNDVQNGTCICKQYDLIWGNKVSCEFRKKVVEICTDLWGEENKIKMANNLMAVFQWESAGTFKSDVPNQANSGGTGLIQFMPNTAKDLLKREVTVESVKNYFRQQYNKKTKRKEDWYLKRVKEFAEMTAIDQLDYVKKYFEPLRGKTVEFVDFYLQVLFPASSLKDEHIVFASSLSKLTTRTSESEKLRNLRILSYPQNSGLDINGDGRVWKSEIKTKVQVYITEGLINKADSFTCGDKPINKKNSTSTTKWHHPVDNPQLRGWYNDWAPNRSIHSSNIPGRAKGKHDGLDLYAPLGTTVYACIDGEVNEIYHSESYGSCINIKGNYNGRTYWFFYAHLSFISISSKDKNGKPTIVKAGEPIGKSGKTGSSASALRPNQVHLHFEVRTTNARTGGRINPFTYISELDEQVNKNPKKEDQP